MCKRYRKITKKANGEVRGDKGWVDHIDTAKSNVIYIR